jgi:hypothetical protein
METATIQPLNDRLGLLCATLMLFLMLALLSFPNFRL